MLRRLGLVAGLVLGSKRAGGHRRREQQNQAVPPAVSYAATQAFTPGGQA